MSIETADVLDRAADIIERNGWWRKSYYDFGAVGSKPKCELACCARGAINLAANGRTPDRLSNLGEDALHALERYLGISGEHPDSVADWNDEPGRTVEEVIAALRGAAKAEREAAS